MMPLIGTLTKAHAAEMLIVELVWSALSRLPSAPPGRPGDVRIKVWRQSAQVPMQYATLMLARTFGCTCQPT